jgi:hypothetical protein
MKRARKSRPRNHPVTPNPAPETVVVPVLAPRNPFIAAAHHRKAGAHGGGARQRRQAEKRDLRRQLEQN